MPYNQDRPYKHFATPSGRKNIPEERAKDMGGMQGKEKPEVKVNEVLGGPFVPWESKDDGFTYGTHLEGEKARPPHSGGKAAREESPSHERKESAREERREHKKGKD